MINRFLNHLEEWLVAFLMGAATIIIFLAVVHRYGQGIESFYGPLSKINMGWAQELCIYMFVWMAKFGAAYGVRTGIHVGVDVAINRMKDRTRAKFIIFGLLAGALFTGLVGTMGANFVWHNGANFAVRSLFGLSVDGIPEGPVTPDLEWPTWIVYLAIPLGSYLMCFRFLQVTVSFWKTGELPHHDHTHVEGVDEKEALKDIDKAEAGGPDLHPKDVDGDSHKENKP